MIMKKVVLFSPSGYVGSFMKETFEKEKDMQVYGITRNSNLESYQMDYDILIYSASVTSARHATADKYIDDSVFPEWAPLPEETENVERLINRLLEKNGKVY